MIEEEWGGGISLAGLALNVLPASVVIVVIIVHLIVVAPSSLTSVKLNQVHLFTIIWDNYLRSVEERRTDQATEGGEE